MSSIQVTMTTDSGVHKPNAQKTDEGTQWKDTERKAVKAAKGAPVKTPVKTSCQALL